MVDTGAFCSVISAASAAKVSAIEEGVKTTLWSGSTSAVCELVTARLGLRTIQGHLLEKKISLCRTPPFQPILSHYGLLLGLNILEQFDFNINYRDRCLILREGAHRVECKYLPLALRLARDLNKHVDSLVFIWKKLTRRIPRPKDATYIGADQVAAASSLYIGVRCVLNGIERKLAAFVDTGATYSMIHPSVLPSPVVKRKLSFLSNATNPFGQNVSPMGMVTLPLVLGCVLGTNIAFEAKLYVFQDCGSQMVIGNDILERFSCRLTNHHVLFSTDDGCVLRVRYADLKD